MSVKRMSLRFNLDNDTDRKAWEYLQSTQRSKNETVIDAINSYLNQTNRIAEIIQQTIEKCFSNTTVAMNTLQRTVTDEESDFLNVMDDFLGD